MREGVPVRMQPLVEELALSGRYSVLLRTGLDFRRLVLVALLAAANILLVRAFLTETRTSEFASLALLLLLLVPAMLVTLFLGVRASLGRVMVEVRRDDILIRESMCLPRTGRQIPRERIAGCWVAGSADEDGRPVPSYSLMADSAGSIEIRIVRDFSLLEPAVALAEDLAKRLGVAADTRGGDFR